MSSHNTTMSDHERQPSARVKWVAISGIYLIRIFSGIPWIWGNISAYTTSYFYSNGMGSLTVAGPWMAIANAFGFNIGMFASTPISKKVGLLTTILLTIVLYNVCILSCFYTVQHSYVALCLTFGLIPGFCGGLNEGNQFKLIVEWTVFYKAVSTSSIPASNLLGALVINILVTLYVNPTNAEAESTQDQMKLFSQSQLLDKVPYTFLLYGGLSLITNCIGFLMLLVTSLDKKSVMKTIRAFIQRIFSKTLIEEQPVVMNSLTSTGTENLDCGNAGHNANSEPHEDNFNLTPKQIIKTLKFYPLFIFMVAVSLHSVAFNTYYKTFGLLYISDDYFLSSIAVFKCGLSPLTSVVAGYFMDKTGVKKTMVFLSVSITILSSFLFITPIVNKWLYFFWCLIYACLIFSAFCMMGPCCLKLFGHAHFRMNLACALSSSVVVIPLAAPLMEMMISNWGWFIFFESFGVVSFLSGILVVVGLPDND